MADQVACSPPERHTETIYIQDAIQIIYHIDGCIRPETAQQLIPTTTNADSNKSCGPKIGQGWGKCGAPAGGRGGGLPLRPFMNSSFFLAFLAARGEGASVPWTHAHA